MTSVQPAPAPQGPAPYASTRRSVLAGGGVALAAGLATTLAGTVAPAAARSAWPPRQTRLTVLATSDLHGYVLNWDYFKNAPFSNAAGDEVGLAKAATLIERVRAERDGPTLTVDCGDIIQGAPLAYYFARIDPVADGAAHPMATAMNLVGYDAATLGNHEFNYGLDTLRAFEGQLDFPLVAANAVDATTKRPVFTPYVVRRVTPPGGGPAIKVGILGLTNPGSVIWDRSTLEGRIEIPGIVEQARRYVPRMRRENCDVIVVLSHSGADTGSSYGDALPYPENASALLAEEVPDIDAIVVGHAHQDISERIVRNRQTGRPVVLTEPMNWGMRLSVIDLDLVLQSGRWRVHARSAQTLSTAGVPEHPAIAAAVAGPHARVVEYVNSPVGESVEELPAARGVVEDVAIIDFVQHVQGQAVKAGLTGADAALPVLSIAAPFNRSAVFPAGELTVRDVAGLYVFDNTLLAVRVTGAQLRDYLEFSARYFRQVSGVGPHTIAELTNAPTPEAPSGTPDYNFDSVAGLDAPLTYDLDLTRPAGQRVVALAYDGAAVGDAQQFVLAVNNYRQSGGGGFPHVTEAEVVVNGQQEIRQLLIDWVTENRVVDPADFASVDWRLVAGGTPLQIT